MPYGYGDGRQFGAPSWIQRRTTMQNQTGGGYQAGPSGMQNQTGGGYNIGPSRPPAQPQGHQPGSGNPPPGRAIGWHEQLGRDIYGTNLDHGFKGQLHQLGIAAQAGDPRAIEAYNKAIYGTNMDNAWKQKMSGMFAPGAGNAGDFEAFANSLPAAHAARVRNAYGRSGMQGVQSLANGSAWMDAYRRWLSARGSGRKMGWERGRGNPHGQQGTTVPPGINPVDTTVPHDGPTLIGPPIGSVNYGGNPGMIGPPLANGSSITSATADLLSPFG